MKTTKKVLAGIMASCMVLGTSTAMAAEPSVVDVSNLALASIQDSSEFEVQQYTKALNEMSNEEFDKAISELVAATDDFDFLKTQLETCGVEIYKVDQQAAPNGVEDQATPYGIGNLSRSDVDISLTAARRGSEGFYRLIATLTFNGYEVYPATLDALSFYFDPDKVDYYDYNIVTDSFDLYSGRYATDGLLVFNFDDSRIGLFDKEKIHTVAVYVSPNGSTQDYVDWGVDYFHSYGETSVDLTGISVGVEFGGIGFAGASIGADFSVEYGEESWQTAELNAFYVD